MPMAALEEIRSLYEGYWDEVARLRAQGKAADGLLGLGGGPASDACQDRFAAAVQEAFERLADLELPAGELQAVLEYVYRIPLEYRKDRVIFWMLLAVQGATLPLVEQLPAAQAALLLERYRKDYPPFERLPVQKKVCAALKSRARESG